MKIKRAQQDIIVTILLLLVALAAISAIAYFIVNQVRSGAAAAGNKAECIKVTIALDRVINASSGNLVMSRQNDDVVVKEINVYVNGVFKQTVAEVPNKLEIISANVSGINIGDNVRINPVLNATDYVCETGSEKTAVAA